ncbi:MAG: ATP-binding protein [Spirochaetia bacterium]
MKTIVVQAREEELFPVQQEVSGFLEEAGVQATIIDKVELVIEELLVNIMQYGYESGPGTITIEYELNESRVFTLIIADEGKKFNPLEKDDPDIDVPASDRQIGGLGIYLVKQIMDSVDYSYRDNKNIMTMKKKLA